MALAKLIVSDPDHSSEVLLQMNTLRKSGQFCDVVLEVMGHNVPAHRGVLACASRFFFDLFSADKDGAQRHFKLEVVDFDSFVALINYMYESRLVTPFKFCKTDLLSC